MRRWLAPCLLVVLWACSGSPQKTGQSAHPESPSWPSPVGEVALVSPGANTPEYALLEIGLVIFDPGIPPDPGTHSKLGIFPEIRKAEARYLPYILRETLVQTQAWGAVRVLPKPDKASELLITGKILHSDGSRLEIQIRAADATGRVWLDRVYRDAASEHDYPVVAGAEPYIDLHRQIANDLLAFREQFSCEHVTVCYR